MERTAAALPRRPQRGTRARRSARSRPRRALPRAASWLASVLGRRRRTRLALICAAAVLAVLAGGWLWLRHSSLTAVRQVRVSGLHGPEAGQIDAALVSAARRMSTLDVNVAALRAAVAPFAVVRAVDASASFPHTLRVHVLEQRPVAVLADGSWHTAVAADGVVLGQALIESSLPTLPATAELAQGARVPDAGVRAALAVLGAAPAPLLRAVARAYEGPRGLTVAMRNGLLVYFGDEARPHAKWLALISVLSDPGSTGASYIDVRLPERPAAGFPPGVRRPAGGSAAEGTGSEAAEQGAEAASVGAQQDTIEALAAALGKAAGVGTSSEPGASGEERGAAGGGGSGSGSGSGSGRASSESKSETQSGSGEAAGGEATGHGAERKGAETASHGGGEGASQAPGGGGEAGAGAAPGAHAEAGGTSG